MITVVVEAKPDERERSSGAFESTATGGVEEGSTVDVAVVAAVTTPDPISGRSFMVGPEYSGKIDLNLGCALYRSTPLA